MYYVAYGSNLDVKQMAYRCPHANVVGTGTIQDYKFVFDVHADIRKAKGNNVKVVVWDIDEYDLESLDMYEGYPVYYIRKKINVDMDDGATITNAIVYVMNNHEEYFMPTNDYLKVIINSYKYWGFDINIVHNALIDCETYIPNNKFVCSKCFNNVDKCNCNADRHRQWIEIDRPIQKTIRILNEKGYKTIYCCSGHNNHDNLYIYFNNRNVPECNLDGVMWDKKHTAMYYWYNPNEDFKTQQKEFVKKLEKWAESLK